MSEMTSDGWIEWSGGDCPVEQKAWVDVKFRDGRGSAMTHTAGYWDDVELSESCWHHEPCELDIVAYRVVTP